MHTVQTGASALFDELRRADIRAEHTFLNQTVRIVARAR